MVYSDEETLEDNIGWEEIIGGDLSGFQLSTGAYYLCRHDFFELMEVGRVTPDWFRILVGDTIDYTEVRGWRKTGRPKQVNPSFTELKTIRCIVHGPQLEDIYNIAEMSKSSIGDKSVAFTSSFLEEEMKSGTESDETMVEVYYKQELYDNQELMSDLETVGDFMSIFDEITIEESDPFSHKLKESVGMYKAFGSDEIKESDSDSPPHEERLKSVVKDQPSVGMSKAFDSDEIKESDSDSPPHEERLKSVVKNQPSDGQKLKKIVLAVNLSSQTKRRKMLKELSSLQGIESVDFDKEGKLIVIGDVDPGTVIKCATKIADTEILSVGPASERQHETEVKPGSESENDNEADIKSPKNKKSACSVM